MAISRSREYQADASGAAGHRRPAGAGQRAAQARARHPGAAAAAGAEPADDQRADDRQPVPRRGRGKPVLHPPADGRADRPPRADGRLPALEPLQDAARRPGTTACRARGPGAPAGSAPSGRARRCATGRAARRSPRSGSDRPSAATRGRAGEPRASARREVTPVLVVGQAGHVDDQRAPVPQVPGEHVGDRPARLRCRPPRSGHRRARRTSRSPVAAGGPPAG